MVLARVETKYQCSAHRMSSTIPVPWRRFLAARAAGHEDLRLTQIKRR